MIPNTNIILKFIFNYKSKKMITFPMISRLIKGEFCWTLVAGALSCALRIGEVGTDEGVTDVDCVTTIGALIGNDNGFART